MSTQYNDGSWSATEPFDEALKRFLEGVDGGTARAFHVGTPEELEQRKQEAALRDRVDELAAKVRELEAEQPNALVRKPTPQELKRFLSEA